jgi:CRISPR-associated endoribonuclease Cas6
MLIDHSKLPAVLPLRVEFRAREPQLLPAFLGSALHGAVGRALWKTVCVFPRRHQCTGCPLVSRCAYPALFATSVPAAVELESLRIGEQAPRPLALSPEDGWTRPSGHPRRVDRGAIIPFRVTLIGPAIDDLALLVLALRRAAEDGIGKCIQPPENPTRSHARAELVRITAKDESETIFDEADQRLRPATPSVLSLSRDAQIDRVGIRLITPLRLKRDGQVCGRPRPADFALALARRANALAALYGVGGKPADEAAVERAANSFEVEDFTTRLLHVRRYSARQGRKMDWPGVIGYFQWRGAPILEELWPLLRFGELVQVGKGTALGFGRYIMVTNTP